jgi:hypothetical protein
MLTHECVLELLKLSCDVNECKPLLRGLFADSALAAIAELERLVSSSGGQGLTLVHFSAQLQPCLSQESTLHTLNTP